ncbi:hypothetical protein [Cupriavidus plantarum]|uniref:hypothetical protein n=1 Tax=Cupriavidus plantarum TaxID=942865 RepID=UPI0015CBCC64|nr:hypothetical protein [Cupriavidus plantarum]NYI02854.1 hypothetical protein [Cupriavidus plantarum]
MAFDATSIEYAFAKLLGNEIGARGTVFDADIFRAGREKDLARVLGKAADALEARVNRLSFPEPATLAGGSKARIDVAVARLRRIAGVLSTSTNAAAVGYSWEVIGCLVSTIAALLEELER